MSKVVLPPLPEPVYHQWRRKNMPWSLEFAFNSMCHATTDDSEVRTLHSADQMHAHAAAVSAADNAALRDERDNMAAAIAQLLRDNRDVHEKVVRPLRERVRVLEDARPEPDCRTCKRAAIQHGVTRCTSPYFCTNGDRYEPLPPVRLWRTT